MAGLVTLLPGRRYILLYELITGEAFQFPEAGQSIQERIRNSLAANL